jgi:DNA polymerase-3 subunit beta
MKINLLKEELLYAVNAVERAVSTKNTLPVLGGIMITAEDNKLSFRATDLEMAIECVINAQIEENGEMVIPGRKLSALAKGLVNGPLQLESSGEEQLLIKYSRGQIALPCFSPEEFPLLPSREGEISGTIPVKTFKRMVRQTGIAASTDELRPVFTGIMLDIDNSDITMVATDTHRLSVAKDSWQGEGKTKVIAPNKVMQEICRLAGNDDDNIIITISSSQIYFSFANLNITSRLIVGQFPDYHQVIPEDSLFTSRLLINRQELIGSLELATVISREISRGKGSIVRLNLQENEVNIYASSQEEGTFDENLPAQVSGELMELNYNARYLLDVLRVLEDEQIAFNLTGPTTPGIIRADSEDSDKYLYLVLPVRISK